MHSPFKYLNHVFPNVLSKVEAEEAKLQKEEEFRIKSENYVQEQESQRESEEAMKDEVYRKIDLGLKQTFSDSDLEIKLNELYKSEISKNPSLKGLPKDVILLKVKRDLARKNGIISENDLNII